MSAQTEQDSTRDDAIPVVKRTRSPIGGDQGDYVVEKLSSRIRNKRRRLQKSLLIPGKNLHNFQQDGHKDTTSNVHNARERSNRSVLDKSCDDAAKAKSKLLEERQKKADHPVFPQESARQVSATEAVRNFFDATLDEDSNEFQQIDLSSLVRDPPFVLSFPQKVSKRIRPQQ